ncbi:MAG: DUF5606 domain-containing protein [Bacteroidales bacterium]|nr:DUF5606 domain-containing protein [Bacteroidales bacterium]
MNLKDILAISGKGGLFKFISQAKNSIIVESFTDGKRMAVHSSAKVSALEDIAIFTETEEVPLGDVFSRIFEKEGGKETINHKSSPEELKAFLESVLPEYDRERVYVSDMKKLVQWYNQLVSLNLLIPKEEEKKEEEKAAEEPIAEKEVKKAPAKAAAAKPAGKSSKSN